MAVIDDHNESNQNYVVEDQFIDGKLCSVCGDKALGYNFNAVTCESCKAFFRRNALKTKEFRCPFTDSCKIDKVTRRFCQRCRLRRCFEVGMRKEWILTEEEKSLKRRKIEENRNYREQESPTRWSNELEIALSAEFGYTEANQLAILTDAEQARLQELLTANEAMESPLIEDGVMTHTSDPSLINVINLTDVAIRRLIRMGKRITAFKSLCQADQVALLKGGCTEMLILRAVMSFDPDHHSWKIPHSDTTVNHIKVDILKAAPGNVYEQHQRFIQSFQPCWRTNDNIMLLLGAITLFSPNRPNVIHHDVVRLEQDTYFYLLRRYLQTVFDGCEARSCYLQLLQRLTQLHILHENHVRVFLDVNLKEIEPLLIEIFDLKPKI